MGAGAAATAELAARAAASGFLWRACARRRGHRRRHSLGQNDGTPRRPPGPRPVGGEDQSGPLAVVHDFGMAHIGPAAPAEPRAEEGHATSSARSPRHTGHSAIPGGSDGRRRGSVLRKVFLRIDIHIFAHPPAQAFFLPDPVVQGPVRRFFEPLFFRTRSLRALSLRSAPCRSDRRSSNSSVML